MMALEGMLDLKTLDLRGQRVFLRLDLNVPLKEGKVLDHNRIKASLPTLHFLISQGAKVLVASHLGRPKTVEDQKTLSLKPVASALNKEGFGVLFMETPDSDAPYELLKGLGGKKIVMLENLRFAKGETENSGELAARWARYTDVYINDAFGVSHRNHASMVALPQLVSRRCQGFLVTKEVEFLTKIRDHPPSPFVLVSGGGKVSDKLGLLESLAGKVNHFIIGGAMACSFLKAKGYDVGASKVEQAMLPMAKKFLSSMEAMGKKVHLPLDHVVVKNLESERFEVTPGPKVPESFMAVDIGPQTCVQFAKVLEEAACVFWNGPMGVYEQKPFHKGSVTIAQALGQSKALSIVGRGGLCSCDQRLRIWLQCGSYFHRWGGRLGVYPRSKTTRP